MKLRKTVTLATRNLLRHRRRTVITAGAVAVGLMMFILTDSLLVGIEEESTRNLIWYETGAAQVVHENYLAERNERPLKYAIDNPEAVEAQLESVGLDATQRIVFSADLVVFRDPYPEDGSIRVTGYGIDPADDGAVYRLRETVTAGEFLRPGSDEAVIGAWLAEDIGAEVGYPLTLVTRTRDGYYQTIDVTIGGIVTTPNPIVNRTAVFVTDELAGEYLGMDGAATEIAVAPTTGRSIPEITATMEEQLADMSALAVVDWRALAADVVAIAETKETGSGTILFLVFVIAAVGVSNTVLMSVLERTRELGMMRAIGMRNGEVMAVLLLEAAGIGLLGGLAGALLGAGVVAYMVEIGINFGGLIQDMDIGYRVAQVMYGSWNPGTFGQAIVAGIVIAVATAIVPVRRALRMPVVDALRRTT